MGEFYEMYYSTTVLEDEPRESLVLDKNGQPYSLVKRNRIGFDLTPRRRKNAPYCNL